MTEFTFVPESEHDTPSLKDVGRILVEVTARDDTRYYRFNYAVHEYEGSAFWIQEGQGFDYFLDEETEITGPGWYVLEGIIGTYTRGDGWEIDDDEDWEVGLVRAATEEEIKSQSLT